MTDTQKQARKLKDFLLRKVPELFEEKPDFKFGERGGEWAWKWGYWGRALSRMYCATNDQDILNTILYAHEKLLEYRDDRLGLVDERRNKILKSWSSVMQSHENVGPRINEVVNTGLILLPFTDLLLRAEKDQLSSDTREKLTQTVSEGIEAFLDEFVDDPRSNGGYFIFRRDDMIEALNHQNVFGAAAAEAYAITKDVRFKDVAEKLQRYFKYNWYFEDNGTVSWPYRPSLDTNPMQHPPQRYGRDKLFTYTGGEFFYKAAVSILLPIALHRAGIETSDIDLKLISKSIRDNIFMPNAEINYYISPRKIHLSSDEIVGKQPTLRPHFLYGFILLSPYDPQLHDRLLQINEQRTDLFPQQWFSGPSGVMALSELCYGALRQEN